MIIVATGMSRRIRLVDPHEYVDHHQASDHIEILRLLVAPKIS